MRAKITSDGPAFTLDGAAVKRGGRVIWSHGTLAVPRGDVVIVIGPNGSGKTTLLKTLLGLVTVSSGSVQVLGDAPRRGNPRIGYVPQNYTATIGDAVTVRDLVSLGVAGDRWGLGRISHDERQRVDDAIVAVGAVDVAKARMSQLSGGQQQRAAIAQALVGEPDILLLDEPLANLDVRNQHEIVALLGSVRRRRDVTIVVVAHDLNPLLPVLSAGIYLLDGHPHYDHIGDVVDEGLLTHLYGTPIKVARTAAGDTFTRTG